MSPHIHYPNDWEIANVEEGILKTMFPTHTNVKLAKEYGDGQSDTRVFWVELDRSGHSELPAVVKIGPADLIRHEWQMRRKYIDRRLSGLVSIREEPLFLPASELTGEAYGGLIYDLAGDGLFPIDSLRDYTKSANACEIWALLEGRLFKQLGKLWQATLSKKQRRPLHLSYDPILPVNLVMQPLTDLGAHSVLGKVSKSPGRRPKMARSSRAHLTSSRKISGNEGTDPMSRSSNVVILNAEQIRDEGEMPLPFQPGNLVYIQGFVVDEIERQHNQVTLNLPPKESNPYISHRLRLSNVPAIASYEAGMTFPATTCVVMETRQSILNRTIEPILGHGVNLSAETVNLPGASHTQLPNPLRAWPELLARQMCMKIATIHGDLNMGNVLVESNVGIVHFIDCAKARQDHVLHDLLRMEMETLLYPLTAALFREGLGPETIHTLYRYVHAACQTEPHEPQEFAIPAELNPALVPVYVTLMTIRNQVRNYLAIPGNWCEYYVGLVLYMLGALKFKSLDKAPVGHQPKAIAFWGAATVLWLLEGNDDMKTIEWVQMDLITKAQEHGETTFKGDVSGPVHTDSGNIYVHRPTLPFFIRALKSWNQSVFDWSAAPEHMRSSWAGMVIYAMRRLTDQISPTDLLMFLIAASLWIISTWLIAPVLAWPLDDPSARLNAFVQFGIASLLIPTVVAGTTHPDRYDDFELKTFQQRRTLFLLKLSGAFAGFIVFSGGGLITLVLLLYHFGVPTLSVGIRNLLVLLPLFWSYIAARRIPADRYKMFDGELKMHEADPFMLTVLSLLGPFMAGCFYLSYWFLVNRAFGLTMLLGMMGLVLWEYRKQHQERLSDIQVILILGFCLPFAILLLALFVAQPNLPIPSGLEFYYIALVLIYILCFTLLLATIFVRNQPVLTLKGTLIAAAIVLVTSYIIQWNLWIGRGLVITLICNWAFWGHRRFRRHFWWHPSFWAMFGLIGAAIYVETSMSSPIWLNTLVFMIASGLLTKWAYIPEQSRSFPNEQPGPHFYATDG